MRSINAFILMSDRVSKECVKHEQFQKRFEVENVS
jgi:hypothetical protein